MTDSMNIGQAAKMAGATAKMIRHYEEIGLLPAALRTEAGYRQYSVRDVAVLRFVRRARRFGFSTQQIASLLGFWANGERASHDVNTFVQRHVDDLDVKMRELAEMKASLEQLVSACRRDDHAGCAILEGLGADGPATLTPVSMPTRRSARRRSGESDHPPARAMDAASAVHVDLMAWAGSLRQQPESP
jgi:MerR family transcriptional regulator, copper efflux regulator